MKITHITASVTASGGGIPAVLQSLSAAQVKDGISTRVLGHQDGGAAIRGWPEGTPTALAYLRFPGMPWAGRMAEEVRQFLPDLIHSHGLWSQPSIIVPGVSQSENIPYLVSAHGMLDPWALGNSRWKKRLAAVLYEKRNLEGAACMHALCSSEAESMRSYGLKNPICVIPNGVDLVDAETLKTEMLEGEQKILLFLGRLHPKKGLVNALRAWAEVRRRRSEVGDREQWHFVIAGWDQGGHQAELKRLCDELGLPYSEVTMGDIVGGTSILDDPMTVIFAGPAFGEAKDDLFRNASAFILPSFSEGLPMSVLEAWSYSLPVLMTDHCNLPEGFADNAAICIGTDCESITEGIQDLLRSQSSDLRALGRNGRALVERQFAWQMVAAQMKEVYDWIVDSGPIPSTIV